jgi:hypothetical protein
MEAGVVRPEGKTIEEALDSKSSVSLVSWLLNPRTSPRTSSTFF